MTTALSGPVRVRFAPSPTGYLHVGGARTAIYNELLSRSLGGVNILRIEDTDRARSDEAMTGQIQDALAWLGVEYDEGPFLQSDRVDHHRATAQRLLDEGKAWRDFRTPDEIEEIRTKAHEKGVTLKSLMSEPTAEEASRRAAAGEPFSVRFRMPGDDVEVADLVKGPTVLPGAVQEDFIILRSDGSPTYHLSVVCDDIEMAVTDVIRGDDHLDNTAKHVRLFEALGASVPRFAHLPLILGPDRKRLSKRTGATSVEEFREQGLLPQALYNYLVLLGWSPGDDREVMDRDELVGAYTVERLGSSASVFDTDKLAWMNAQYMSGLDLEALLPHLEPFAMARGLGDQIGTDRFRDAVVLHRGRARTLVELAEMIEPHFLEEIAYDEKLSRKYLRKDPQLVAHLGILWERYDAAEPYDVERLEAVLRELAETWELSAGALIHPNRMAISGRKAGPPLFDLVEAMGREATGLHLGRYMAYLEGLPPEPPTLDGSRAER